MKCKALTQKQKQALEYYRKCYDEEEIKKKIKISTMTLWRWKQLENFRQALDEIKQSQNLIMTKNTEGLIEKSQEILMDMLEHREKKLHGYAKIALKVLEIYRPKINVKEVVSTDNNQSQEKENQKSMDTDIDLSQDDLEKMLGLPYMDE